ncbi:redoxin domain-containing protein [Variovorax sp. GT1P44]|uniref:redoxin domain-containing protein n=1 Tax=Variovorax sp. GT1P44 TaxID=3443742 RepID=UPI003F473A7A
MGEQKRPLRPGESAPPFSLPAANREELVSLDSLRGRAFFIGFYRGLHCPFCRRQVLQLASVEPPLRAMGVETLAVINTQQDRARLYFRYRPTPVALLCDPDCHTHRAFGVPHLEFLPDDIGESQWPYRASMAEFAAARINPTGELPEPTQPIEANTALNLLDGFEMDDIDSAILAGHAAQLVGHFLVDAAGVVRWVQIEALDGPNSLSVFPNATQIVAAAGSLGA